MTSKEALERIKLHKYVKCEELEIIENDLKRLEAIEYNIKILEDVMDILHLCICFVKNTNGEYVVLPKSNIREEEYDLIKKFLM